MSEQASHQQGNLWRRIGLGLLVLVFLTPVVLGVLHYRSRIFIFSGLSGPSETSTVKPAVPANWRTYQGGDTARLAILLTDEASAWLGLVHGLKSLGVPFTVTRDVSEALRHKVVLVYPYVSGLVLKPDELRRLAAHPTSGGTLVAANVLGGGLKEVFGFADVQASRKRFAMDFSAGSRTWLGFDEPEEKTVRFGDPARSAEAQLGTHGYGQAFDAVAAFDDGAAAIARRRCPGGGVNEPRTRVGRHAFARPLLQRCPESIVQPFLGDIEVAKQADQHGKYMARVSPIDGIYRLAYSLSDVILLGHWSGSPAVVDRRIGWSSGEPHPM